MPTYFPGENVRLLMEEIVDLSEKTNMRLTLKLYSVAVQGVQPARLSPCKKTGDGLRYCGIIVRGFITGWFKMV